MEGWHGKINRVAGKAHPNIFETVELFKGEQATLICSRVCVDKMGVDKMGGTQCLDLTPMYYACCISSCGVEGVLLVDS